MRLVRFCAAALGLLPVTGQAEAAEAVRLVPHRAVYDLSLDESRGLRSLDSARGRIVFEFTGDACSGYALNFRQVTVLDSAETGRKTSDLRTTNYESEDGRTFQFRNESIMDGRPGQVVEGTARHEPGKPIALSLKGVKDSVTIDGAAIFPSAQMRDLIVAARAGQTTLSMKLFDGSDDGQKLYDTLAVIGHEARGSDGLEKAAQQPGLAALARWPITMSYFGPDRSKERPDYVLSFDLYENGVSRNLKLDYGDFALRGQLDRLDLLPDKSCAR